MKLTAESYGHAVILNISGELTEDSLQAFRQSVEHQLNGDRIVDLVLNMEDVPFVDSAVLEYLVDLQAQMLQKHGQVKLIKCDENMLKILEITRLNTMFEVAGDVADVLKASYV